MKYLNFVDDIKISHGWDDIKISQCENLIYKY